MTRSRDSNVVETMIIIVIASIMISMVVNELRDRNARRLQRPATQAERAVLK